MNISISVRGVLELNRTSQLSRMKQSAAAADLSGGKASEASLTPRSVILAAEDTIDPTFDLFLDFALGSVLSPEEFVRGLFPFPRTVRSRPGAGSRSRLHGRERLDERSGRNLFAYRWIPDHRGSRGRKLLDGFLDLESIRRHVGPRSDQLPLGLQRGRSRRRFVADEGFLAERETFGVPCHRFV